MVDLNCRAVERSVEIVNQVQPHQLGGPSPCAGWTLGELLAHMIAQHHGFAIASEGNHTDLSQWAPQPLGPDPAASYAAAAAQVIEAFAQPQAQARSWWLPEIRHGGPFPAEMAIGFHLLDYVVHGWDVAASIAIAADYSPDLVEAALEQSARVPDGPARTLPGAAFAPARPGQPGQSALDRLLLGLGRRPDVAG